MQVTSDACTLWVDPVGLAAAVRFGEHVSSMLAPVAPRDLSAAARAHHAHSSDSPVSEGNMLNNFVRDMTSAHVHAHKTRVSKHTHARARARAHHTHTHSPTRMHTQTHARSHQKRSSTRDGSGSSDRDEDSAPSPSSSPVGVGSSRRRVTATINGVFVRLSTAGPTVASLASVGGAGVRTGGELCCLARKTSCKLVKRFSQAGRKK